MRRQCWGCSVSKLVSLGLWCVCCQCSRLTLWCARDGWRALADVKVSSTKLHQPDRIHRNIILTNILDHANSSCSPTTLAARRT